MNKKLTCIKSEVVKLTPQLAKELLATNVGYQRHLSRARVETYSHEIKAKRFLLTGQGIIINNKGQMINGQHRCAATIMANKSIPEMLVIRGIDNKAFPYLDTGKQRSASDLLSIQGYTNTNALAAFARVVLCYDMLGELHVRHTYKISNASILALVESNSARYVNLIKRYTTLRPCFKPLGLGSAVPGLHMILSNKRVSAALIEEFMTKLALGEQLTKSHPVFQLRQMLITAASTPQYRLQLHTKDARLITTWNSFLKGESGPNSTQWNGLKDDFPKILTKAS